MNENIGFFLTVSETRLDMDSEANMLFSASQVPS